MVKVKQQIRNKDFKSIQQKLVERCCLLQTLKHSRISNLLCIKYYFALFTRVERGYFPETEGFE